MTAMPETTGTIYDIGYRHYDGPRLGRRGAIGAIVGAGLRAVFGFGRSGRSKIIPWGAVILAAQCPQQADRRGVQSHGEIAGSRFGHS